MNNHTAQPKAARPNLRTAEFFGLTKAAPTPGALRAACRILHPDSSITASSEAVEAARIIDRETSAPELETLVDANVIARCDIADECDRLKERNAELLAALRWSEAMLRTLSRHVRSDCYDSFKAGLADASIAIAKATA